MPEQTNAPIMTTISSDTTIEWIERAFTWRTWWGRRYKGKWWASHKQFPGLYGLGDTVEAAADDLVAAVHCCRPGGCIHTARGGV